MSMLAGAGAAGTSLRPMRFGSLLGIALRVSRDHFRLLFLLALLSHLPAVLVGQGTARIFDQAALWQTLTLGCSISLVYLVLLAPISQAAITYAIAEIHLGRPVSLGQSLRASLTSYWALVGTYAAWGAILLLGFLLLVPGLYLMILSVFLFPVMVIEKTFGLAAFRRCRALARGQLARTLAVFAIAEGVALTIAIGGELLGLSDVAKAALEGVALLGTIYGTTLEVLFYLETRARREALGAPPSPAHRELAAGA